MPADRGFSKVLRLSTQTSRTLHILTLVLLTLLGIKGDFAWGYTHEGLLTDRPDPELSYCTLHSPHFDVHFPCAAQRAATEVSLAGENAYQRIKKRLHWTIESPAHIVALERSDVADVFTSVFPQREIYLEMVLPEASRGLNEFGDYFDWVITHEYTHMAHLDLRGGIYRPLASVFGSWVRPNLATPPWLKEGLAVYMESTLTPHGRGVGTTYPMMMRTAVAENALRTTRFANPSSIANFDAKDWPWTLRPYLMGYYLVRTLIRNSPVPTEEIFAATSEAVVFSLESLIEKAGFKSFDELWERTLSDVEAESRLKLAELSKKPFTEIQYLTETGQLHYGITLSPDGKRLVCTYDQPDVENSIIGFDLKGDEFSRPETVVVRGGGYQSAFSRSGRFLLFDEIARAERYSLFSDIQIYDLKTRQYVTASPYARARDSDAHPDGQHVSFVINQGDQNELVMTDTAWENPRALLAPAGHRRITGPRFSPDGTRIVTSVHNSETGGEDLWLVDTTEPDDPEKAQAEVLVADGSLNFYPSWTSDGRYILYSSDRSGVSNIYALEVKTREVHQLTHVVGGLTNPVADPQLRWVYVSSYRSTGYDVARFRWNPSSWVKVAPGAASTKPVRVAAFVTPAEAPLPAETRVEPYDGIHYLKPLYLRPSLMIQRYTTQYGGELGSVDPLYQYSWNLDLRYDTLSGLPVGRFEFLNAAHPWAWETIITHAPSSSRTAGDSRSTLQGEITFSIPVSQEGNYSHVRWGILGRSQDTLRAYPDVGPHLGYRRDTRFKDIGLTFHEFGHYIDLDVRHLFSLDQTSPARGGSTSITARLEKHQRMSWGIHHVLHLTAQGAATVTGTTSPNGLFTAGGQESFPFTTGTNLTLYSYPPDQFISSTAIGIADALYTFPIKDIQNGPGILPLTFGRMSLGVRAQAGAIRTTRSTIAPWSTGVELYQDLVAGHVFGFTAKLGAYYGPPSQGGEFQTVFSITGSD